MRWRAIFVATLLAGCTQPAEVTEPGLWECVPTNPLFAALEPIRFDSRTADARADWPRGDIVQLTTVEGRRVELRTADPARWACEKLIDYEAERDG